MTQQEKRLVETLKARQQHLGLNDTAFAKLINLGQSHWWKIKHGQRGVGRVAAARILKGLPDLWREVQAAMIPQEDAA